MRIVIVSDIHSNLAALEAVLKDAASESAIDGVWSLGDSVGYGPQPSECVARLRQMNALMVAGNHERAATGVISTDDFNPDARAAAQWTKKQLDHGERAFLDSLPEVLVHEGFTLVHGTLRDPIWEYLHGYEAAASHLRLQTTTFGLFGHTHIPTLVVEGGHLPQGCALHRLHDGARVELNSEAKIALNPGSVGQPRDHDPRASYAVYDADEGVMTWHRVEYDIAATQRLMEDARLPRWLIERLAEGR